MTCAFKDRDRRCAARIRLTVGRESVAEKTKP